MEHYEPRIPSPDTVEEATTEEIIVPETRLSAELARALVDDGIVEYGHAEGKEDPYLVVGYAGARYTFIQSDETGWRVEIHTSNQGNGWNNPGDDFQLDDAALTYLDEVLAIKLNDDQQNQAAQW